MFELGTERRRRRKKKEKELKRNEWLAIKSKRVQTRIEDEREEKKNNKLKKKVRME